MQRKKDGPLFIFFSRHFFLAKLTLNVYSIPSHVFNPIYCQIPYEPVHEISNNVVCATTKASDQPAHTRSLIRAFACRSNILWVLSYWLNIILRFLSLKRGCTGLFESTLAKLPHCWKSLVTTHIWNHLIN